MRKTIRRCSVFAGVLVASAATFSADPPDLKINVASGLIEVVDAAWSGNNYNVRFSQVTSAGVQVASTVLTSSPGNDLDPRIASAPSGETVVVWWRDSRYDIVLFRLRAATTGLWGPERTVGRTTESGNHPRVVYSSGMPWVAYQIQTSKTLRSVGASLIDDDPEPFRSIIATTSYTGDLDIHIESEMNHLWVTWVDNASQVGYSEYDAQQGLWAVPTYESFASDSVTAARSRIRENVLDIGVHR